MRGWAELHTAIASRVSTNGQALKPNQLDNELIKDQLNWLCPPTSTLWQPDVTHMMNSPRPSLIYGRGLADLEGDLEACLVWLFLGVTPFGCPWGLEPEALSLGWDCLNLEISFCKSVVCSYSAMSCTRRHLFSDFRCTSRSSAHQIMVSRSALEAKTSVVVMSSVRQMSHEPTAGAKQWPCMQGGNVRINTLTSCCS